MNRHPFRLMRITLRLTQAQCALLLATDGIAEWTQQDYAMLFTLNEIWHKMNNPTYRNMIGILGATLRFYRGLVDRMSAGDLKVQCESEWTKLSAGFEDLLEVQPLKQ